MVDRNKKRRKKMRDARKVKQYQARKVDCGRIHTAAKVSTASFYISFRRKILEKFIRSLINDY